ncbi:hypothetical protein Agub_g8301 [Astrephomene gubernaculifera]|uniref:Cyclin N-terminal domain-containing protein n=1 Tax=Astrephomene gubernaculifera TaxID=47775 RepID=A0AAD3HN10_9CHLO|nr:hypothetical protein Agub_g8301 [Astrephomene gubernaculifera]
MCESQISEKPRQLPQDLQEQPSAPDSPPHEPAVTSSSPSTAAVRCVLLGWLSEVADWLQLGGPTLVAGVRLLDAFLEKQSLRPPDSLLQLLALTCLAEATRAGEPHIRPSLHEWASLAVNPATGEPLYEIEDFKRMRSLLVATLDGETKVARLCAAVEHCN